MPLAINYPTKPNLQNYSYHNQNGRKKRFCENLEKEILKNLDNPDYQIDDLCQAMLMSRTHLYRRIKEHLNSSFTEILIHKRINLSENLLLHTSLTISEVAYQSGFKDPSYFVRVFRKENGCTPKGFRNVHTNTH